ncbi:PEP-CTERM sorting domain-containing protein [Verrucomicrobiaceae bacterium N1E253]|uniref:PEP-CTERM sorting domain-containing protein n=1 Tax=Oceaniferula marina TaxID=2748318 RepID=A0A851GGV2_9BACT|nr:PEP-CTERM sorting domain-containing protein [Oceaniferula marina]NWK55071.1 PEP-CTERM sorting domain-containing protein [Oceaniferula marina]
MIKTILTTSLIASAGFANAAVTTLFSSDFDGNTGAHVFAGNTDNTSGSANVTITDWTQDSSVTSISGLTAIATGGGGFAQLGGGTATYAGPNNIYLSRNHNQGTADHGYSLTFTIDTSWAATNLNVLSGHTTNTGTQDQSYTSDLNFSISGGTLGAAVTGISTEDYSVAPAYHSVNFDLTGTTLGAGTYTLQVFQNNNASGSYAIYNGVTLEATAVPEPTSAALFGLGGISLILRRRK